MSKEMSSLFKIQQGIIDTLDNLVEIEETTGVVDEDLVEELSIGMENLQSKSGSLVHVIKYLEAEEIMSKEESIRISGVRKRNNKKIENIKAIILQAVLMFGNQAKPTKAQRDKGREGTRSITAKSGTSSFKCSDRQYSKLDITLDVEEFDKEYVKVEVPSIKMTEYDLIIDSIKKNTELGEERMKELLNALHVTRDSKSFDRKRIQKDLSDTIIEGATLNLCRSLSVK